ncbi:glycosyltransferase [Capilliphycus salinus ALCB114379]|uniref:glycosyltransferase n=1 Tax=Capilliphycus salinus TaxID=2768948 RepID=UPI0039A5E88B
MPRVSVVIPTYNQEAYISQALDSVLKQTYQDFEIVIVNDASGDRTLEKIQEKKDPRIRLFSFEQNQGESAATNYGIQQARGELIALLHSDDVFVPQKLEKQVECLEKNPQFNAILTYPQLINSRGERLPPSDSFLQQVFIQPNRTRFQWLNSFFSKDNCLCQTSALIRRECYQQIGFYDPRFRQIPDFDFWVRFCLKYELYILPEPLVNYRVHQSNISGIKPETIIRHNFELSQVLKRYFCVEVYENLLKIFPDALEPGEIFEPSLGEFLVARQLFKIERSPHRTLSLDTLFNLLGDPEKSRLIKQYYNFDSSRFSKLTGSFDIFNLMATQKLKTQSPQPPQKNQTNPTFSPPTFPTPSQPPLVSLIIPTYNGETFLAEAINSAISQTYRDLEIIISDDGSSDKTLEIAKSFQHKTPVPFQILAHSNYGLVENLNFSISQARGKYIKFLFQDDLLEPNCIETMVHLAEQNPEIGLVFSPRRVFIADDSQSNPLCQAALNGGKNLHQKWSNLKPIQSGQELLSDPNCLKGTINKIGEPTTVLIPKAVFEKIGGFDDHLHQLLDGDLWLRIMGNYQIGFVNQTLSSLRIHRQQQTQKNISAGQNLKDYQRLYEKMLFHPDYHFLTAEFKSGVFQKLMAKTQEYFPLTQNLIEQYRKNPLSDGILTYLRQIRQILASRWLTLSINELKQAYQGDWGETHRALMACGLLEEQQTDSEKIFVRRLTQQVALGFQEVQGIQVVLAAMLYQKAYQLPLQYQNALIPKYIFQDFLEFLFAEIEICPELAEIQRFVEFRENLLNYIYHNLINETTNPVWLYIASIYSKVPPGETWKLCPPQQNLKTISSYRADIIDIYLQQTGHPIEYNFTDSPSPSAKINLGIFIDKIGFNSDTFAMIPILKNLDLTNFNPVLYTFSIENDILGELYVNLNRPPVQLPESLNEAVSRIRHDRLDFLLIGSDVTIQTNTSFQLVLHRLARKQIIAASAQITSGIRQIDYILAPELTEAASEQQQYREQVIPLKGSGLCWNYPAQPPKATVEPTRQSWGAREETVVFAVSGKLNAIAAEFRQMWSQILARAPQSILVLLPQAGANQNPPISAFFNRIQSDFKQQGISPKRFVMVKPLSSWTNLKKCLSLANIYLDPYPSYEPSSVVEALLAGAIPVVCEGQTPRHRQSAALLRELGTPELICSTKQDYLELSIALANQPQKRQQYREKIKNNLEKTPAFLDGQAHTKQLENLLKNLSLFPR